MSKKKNTFKRVKEFGYQIIVDGHTTFPEDICTMLDRLDYLEEKNREYPPCCELTEQLNDDRCWGYDKCLLCGNPLKNHSE